MRTNARKFRLALTLLMLVALLVVVFGAVPAWAQAPEYVVNDDGDNTGCPEWDTATKATFATISGALGHAGLADGDTILVCPGTYNAEAGWPINVNKANLTIKSVAGAANTTIDPGGNGRGAIEISAPGVTIGGSGFTIKGGSQASSSGNPEEHVIWVHANNSTIKNNTIILDRGNTAGIYIGGRTDDVPTGPGGTAIHGYQVSTPTGHTIQGNSFRCKASGEGWGIFAYELKDSLIKGNQFVGDAADVGNWNADEGAPGTGIIIHKATPFVADTVIIEDNTARYIKYKPF